MSFPTQPLVAVVTAGQLATANIHNNIRDNLQDLNSTKLENAVFSNVELLTYLNLVNQDNT
jgi:hypothetical protein